MTYDWNLPKDVHTSKDVNFMTVECIEDCAIQSENLGEVKFIKGNLYGAKMRKIGFGQIINPEFIGPNGAGLLLHVWNSFIFKHFRPTDRKVEHHADS